MRSPVEPDTGIRIPVRSPLHKRVDKRGSADEVEAHSTRWLGVRLSAELPRQRQGEMAKVPGSQVNLAVSIPSASPSLRAWELGTARNVKLDVANSEFRTSPRDAKSPTLTDYLYRRPYVRFAANVVQVVCLNNMSLFGPGFVSCKLQLQIN